MDELGDTARDNAHYPRAVVGRSYAATAVLELECDLNWRGARCSCARVGSQAGCCKWRWRVLKMIAAAAKKHKTGPLIALISYQVISRVRLEGRNAADYRSAKPLLFSTGRRQAENVSLVPLFPPCTTTCASARSAGDKD